MTKEEFALQLVENTMKNCEMFATECEIKSEEWKNSNYCSDLAEYYDGQARAFRLIAEFLKKDLEMSKWLEFNSRLI